MRDRRLLPAALLILLGAIVVLNFGLLSGQSFFWGLPALQFVPWRVFALEQIAQGIMPYWNPYNGAGAPLIANYQTAIFYPLNWLSFVSTPWMMSVVTALHLLIGGWGMARFTRRLGAPVLGQALAGLAFGLTGYLVARLGTYPTVTAAAWCGWLLWAAYGVIHGKPNATPWLALFTALILLAGHAQTAFYALLLTAWFSLHELWRSRPIVWKRILYLAAAVIIGVAAASVQLIPTAELLGQSQRSGGVEADFALNFSYAPARTLNLLMPNFFGTPADGSYYTEGAYFEDAVYIGLIPLISALTAVLRWLRRRKSSQDVATMGQIPFFITVVIVAFVLALGRYTPIFPFLYENMPTFDLFQAPVRWHLWTVIGLSVLAAFGVEWWPNARRSRNVRRILFACGVLAVLMLGALIVNVASPANIIAREVLIAALLGVTAGVLTIRQPTDGASWRWSLIVLGVVALDLAIANRGLNPTTPSNFYAQQPVADSVGRSYLFQADEDRLRFDEFLRFDDYRTASDRRDEYRSAGLPNMNLLDERAMLNNFEPLLVGHFAQYIDRLEAADDELRSRLLAAAGVGASRAWFVESLCFAQDDAAAWALMQEPERDLRAQPVAVGEGECPPAGAPAQDLPISAVSDTGNWITITFSAPEDGWLVLADTHYPHWYSTVDRYPVEIERVNGAFRAIPVSEGAHTVFFNYRPDWYWPSIVLSLAGVLSIAACFTVGWWFRRKMNS